MKQFSLFLFSVFIILNSSCRILPDAERVKVEIVYVDTIFHHNSDYLAVFGDIQEYTFKDEMMVGYDATISWLNKQLKGGARIRTILNVGDVTQNNNKIQWTRFYNSTETIGAIIPYYVVTGNHDYTWNSSSKIESRETSYINEYCHFPKTDIGIIDYYESNSLHNYVAELYLENRTNLYLLALEFGPRNEILEWANKYVNNHKDKRFLLLTHEWLDSKGNRISNGSFAELQFKDNSSFTTPEQIWQTLVKPNDNIVAVLCGHCGFTAELFSENDNGRMVPQIMFNLQYQANGGNGLIQLWEFPINSQFVSIGVYDTIHQDWYMQDSTNMVISYR